MTGATSEIAQAHLYRLDIITKSTEVKWGLAGRIETLCTKGTADKICAHWDRLSNAIICNEYDDIVLLSDGMVRGWWLADAEAIANGHTPQALPALGVVAIPVAEQNTRTPPQTGYTGDVPPSSWFKAGGDEIPF